jgi:hypothetical protein
VLSRVAALSLALAACAGAAGNAGNDAKGPPAGGNMGGPANTTRTAAASPLTGLWHQREAACPGGGRAPASVEELEFEAGGRALVTFVPFETYHDYWGPYRYDAATGAFAMEVERGNSIPADLDLEGRATLAPNGELVIEDMYFGTVHGEPAGARNCTLHFIRRH